MTHFIPESLTQFHRNIHFTEECNSLVRGINGKEEKPIFIVSELLSDDLLIDSLILTDEYLNFLNHVSSK